MVPLRRRPVARKKKWPDKPLRRKRSSASRWRIRKRRQKRKRNRKKS